MLGRFLEVSVHAPDVQASLEFYESLGFVSAPVGDTRPHPYAVITDGRLFLGLHGEEFDSPTLTWVHPGLALHAPALEALGLEFAFARLGEEAFHELGFVDPSGQMVTIVEARTFSPPASNGRCRRSSATSRSSASRRRTSPARPRSGTRSVSSRSIRYAHRSRRPSPRTAT